MQLVVGGAFAGKRKVARERVKDSIWISAYEDVKWTEWSAKWITSQPIVLEGWEEWILDELSQGQETDQVRLVFQNLLVNLQQEEQKRHSIVTLIMLEMGRGIVPLDSLHRNQRDVNGWVLQDAAVLSDEVHYVWNGLSKRIK